MPRSWTLPIAPSSVQWGAPEAGRVDLQIEFSWAGETARHIGTVVHRWLQRVADDELRGWTSPRISALRLQVRQDLLRRGLRNPDEAAERVVSAIRNSVESERGRWLLGPHASAKSEYRIRTPRGSLVIDRFIELADGTKWIVDFKTSQHEGGNPEAFLDRERERYSGQLRAYSAATGGAKAGIFFPMLVGWREVD